MFNGDVAAVIANNSDYLNSPDMNGKSRMDTELANVAWFNFFGGPRDFLVSTPHNKVASNNEMAWVTTEIKHMYQSLDHASFFFNLRFLNCLVPLIG